MCVERSADGTPRGGDREHVDGPSSPGSLAGPSGRTRQGCRAPKGADAAQRPGLRHGAGARGRARRGVRREAVHASVLRAGANDPELDCERPETVRPSARWTIAWPRKRGRHRRSPQRGRTSGTRRSARDARRGRPHGAGSRLCERSGRGRVCRDRGQAGGRELGVTAEGHGVSFWSDKYVPKLTVAMSAHVYKYTKSY